MSVQRALFSLQGSGFRVAVRGRGGEAGPLGYSRCILPEGNCSAADVPATIELVGVRTVSDAVEQLIDWTRS